MGVERHGSTDHECRDADPGRLAPRPHWGHAVGPHPEHVPLPRHAAGDARRVVTMVGLAVRSQARLVLSGELRREYGSLDLRRRQPGDLVAGHPGDGLRRLAGVQAPQPCPCSPRRRLCLAVAGLVAHRPGDLPVPLLHERAVHRHRPRLLPGRAVARRIGSDVAGGPPRRRARRHGSRAVVARQGAAVRLRARRRGLQGLAGVQRDLR